MPPTSATRSPPEQQGEGRRLSTVAWAAPSSLRCGFLGSFYWLWSTALYSAQPSMLFFLYGVPVPFMQNVSQCSVPNMSE